MPTYSEHGYMTGKTAGTEVSSTYMGRHLQLLESGMTHPSRSSDLVTKGDPIIYGDIVGVAFNSAAAATDYIEVDTEGIWNLTVYATDDGGNNAVAIGNQVFINKTTCLLSKNSNKNTHNYFGKALGAITGGSSDSIAVKVHEHPDDAEEKVGTSSVYYTSATVDKNYREYRYATTATSGTVRGIYNRLQFNANGTTTGESLRSYTEAVGYRVETLHGAHLSLGFGESTTGGSISGLGVAVRATLGFPSVAMASGGTYAAIMPEIYSFGAAADPSAVTELSFIRCINGGDATGIGKVDDKAYLLVYDGGTTATGNVFEPGITEANYAYCARCKVNGVDMYMMFSSDAA